MKRGKPLKRGKGLKPGKPLKRKTPLRAKAGLKRGNPIAATNLMKAGRRATGPSRDVVDAVAERSAHSCEIDGAAVGPVRGVDFHIHHRRPRAMGGTDRPETNWPSNLLLICPPCHEYVESYRTEAERLGWLVSQAADPALVRVAITCRGWVYLTTDGRYSRIPPEKGEA